MGTVGAGRIGQLVLQRLGVRRITPGPCCGSSQYLHLLVSPAAESGCLKKATSPHPVGPSSCQNGGAALFPHNKRLAQRQLGGGARCAAAVCCTTTPMGLPQETIACSRCCKILTLYFLPQGCNCKELMCYDSGGMAAEH